MCKRYGDWKETLHTSWRVYISLGSGCEGHIHIWQESLRDSWLAALKMFSCNRELLNVPS